MTSTAVTRFALMPEQPVKRNNRCTVTHQGFHHGAHDEVSTSACPGGGATTWPYLHTGREARMEKSARRRATARREEGQGEGGKKGSGKCEQGTNLETTHYYTL